MTEVRRSCGRVAFPRYLPLLDIMYIIGAVREGPPGSGRWDGWWCPDGRVRGCRAERVLADADTDVCVPRGLSGCRARQVRGPSAGPVARP